MNISYIKVLDSIIGLWGVLLLPVPGRIKSLSEIRSILIIRPGGIGDAVLLSTLICSIKKTHPRIHITILAERRNCGLFTLIPLVEKVLCYDRPREFFKALRGRYDVVIDSEQWYRLSAVVARLIRSPIKIGFASNERRRMFTHGIRYDLVAYEPENFALLLQSLGVDFQSEVGEITLQVPSQSVSNANQLLQPICSQSFVVMFPGASISEKHWGADRFRRIAELLSVFEIKTVVVGGKEDRQKGEVITNGGLGLNLAGLTSLPDTAAVIQKSMMLLSGDSGVLHIAAGLAVPTVSLFGPGRVEKWAPQGERHIVISKRLSCSPCTMFGTTPPCPHETKCMYDISVDEVAGAVKELLTRIGSRPFR